MITNAMANGVHVHTSIDNAVGGCPVRSSKAACSGGEWLAMPSRKC